MSEGFDIPEGYKKTKVGMIPEDWETTKFLALLKSKNSLAYGILQPGNGVENGIPMLRTVDLNDYGLKSDTILLKVPNKN